MQCRYTRSIAVDRGGAMVRAILSGVVVAAVGAGALIAGCGGDDDGMSESASTTVPASETATDSATDAAAEPVKAERAADRRPTRTTELRLRGSEYGRVLFDDEGGALYLFTKEEGRQSECYGACARAWPPFYARGKLEAGPGVDRSLLGKTERRDGRKQVTYAGRPLYYYIDDPRNEVDCHNVFEFGGDWLAVQASGEPAPT
jgi:predicted lipoprotein with Yx(FWY)xxD motif